MPPSLLNPMGRTNGALYNYCGPQKSQSMVSATSPGGCALSPGDTSKEHDPSRTVANISAGITIPPLIPLPPASSQIPSPSAINPHKITGQREAPKESDFIGLEICKTLQNYKSSKYRYVYKLIIRHMHVHIRKRRESIVEILSRANFSQEDIEHAFFKVGCYSDTVGKKGCDRTSFEIVNKIMSSRSIYVYILRESLRTIVENWLVGKTGRISQKNVQLYKRACEMLYEEASKLLEQAGVA